MPGGRLGLNHRGVAGSREGSSEDSSAIRFERSVDKQVFSSLPPYLRRVTAFWHGCVHVDDAINLARDLQWSVDRS